MMLILLVRGPHFNIYHLLQPQASPVFDESEWETELVVDPKK